MFNLFTSDIKLKEIKNKNIKQINIQFPKKKGHFVDISKDIVKTILLKTPLYVHIDTSFSFLNLEEAKIIAKEIRMLLGEIGIEYMHKFGQDTSNRDSILGLVKIGKRKRKCNIISFIIPQNTNNEKLFDLLIKIGSHLLAPKYECTDKETLDDLLNDNYEDENEKLKAFKFTFFLTGLVTQMSIKTNYLSKDDIKNICFNK